MVANKILRTAALCRRLGCLGKDGWDAVGQTFGVQDELVRLRQNGAHHGVAGYTATKDSGYEHHHQQQQVRELYDAEARLRQRFTARLDRASALATKSPTLYVHTVQS